MSEESAPAPTLSVFWILWNTHCIRREQGAEMTLQVQHSYRTNMLSTKTL